MVKYYKNNYLLHMLVTNNDNVFRQLMYKVNGQYKKALIAPLQTVNLHDLTSESQVFRNLFGLKVHKANTNLSRNLIEDIELEGPSPNYNPATIFSFTNQNWSNTATTVSGWNTLLNLPINGVAFSGMVIDGDGLYLSGGSNINIYNESVFTFPSNMIAINDQMSAITSFSGNVDNNNLISLDLPGLTGVSAFAGYAPFNYGGPYEYFNFPNLTTIHETDLPVGAFSNFILNNSLNLPRLSYRTSLSLNNITVGGDLNLPALTGVCSGLESVIANNVSMPNVTSLAQSVNSTNNVFQSSNFNELNLNGVTSLSSITFHADINVLNLSGLTGWTGGALITATLNGPKKINLDSLRIASTALGSNAYRLREVYAPNLSAITVASFLNASINLSAVNFNSLFRTNSSLFFACSGITSISLPALSGASLSMFNGCTGLTSVYLPSAVTIGNFVFNNCLSIKDISLPSLTGSSTSSFNNCISLTGVSLPLATTIGSQAFYNCSSLTSVSAPVATTITASAFTNCSSLVNISLPSATTIGVHVFKNCTSLTGITLPAVTNLGGSVADNGVFLGVVGKTITLTVPSALMTNNGGNPDGDIQYLQANNSVTIIQV